MSAFTSAHRVVVGLSACVVLTACGGAPRPAQVVPLNEKHEAAVRVTNPTGAAAEPADLFLIARTPHAEKTVRLASRLLGVPFPDPHVLDDFLLGDGVPSPFAWDMPIDLVMTLARVNTLTTPPTDGDEERDSALTTKAHGAISVAAPRFENAREALSRKYTFVQKKPGVVRLVPIPPPPPENAKDDDDAQPSAVHRDVTCEVHGSASATRIVCGDEDASLDTLAPFLMSMKPEAKSVDASNAGGAKSVDDFTFEMRVKPLRTFLSEMGAKLPSILAEAKEPLEVALAEIAKLGFEELSNVSVDTTRIVLRERLSEEGAQLRGELVMDARTSMTSHVLFAKPLPVSESVSRAPAGDDIVNITRGFEIGAADAIALVSLLAKVRHVAELAADKYTKLAPTDRNAVLDAIFRLATPPSSRMTSVSYDAEAVIKAMQAVARNDGRASASKVADAQNESSERALRSAGRPRYLYALEGPPDERLDAWRALVDAYNRPGVQKALRQVMKEAGAKFPLPTVKLTPIKGRPGALAGAITTPSMSMATMFGVNKPAVDNYAFVAVPEGRERLWLATAPDRTKAERAIDEAVRTQSRGVPAPFLKNPLVQSAWSFSPESLVLAVAPSMPMASRWARSVLPALEALRGSARSSAVPERNLSQRVVFTTEAAPSQNGGVWAWTLDIPREVIDRSVRASVMATGAIFR